MFFQQPSGLEAAKPGRQARRRHSVRRIGSDGFMLPAMALIIVCFLVSSKSQKKGEPAL